MILSPARVAGFLLLAAGPALAQSTCTVLPALPVIIVAPGSYCLDRSHAIKSGHAVEIRSSHVTLDLAGHTIENRADPRDPASGVFADGQANITVRGGSLVGFFDGVSLQSRDDCSGDGAGSFRVEDMTVLRSGFTGIRVRGCAVEVRRNRVFETGLSDQHVANAIYVSADTLSVVDNDVQTVTRYAPNTGIAAYGKHGVLERNRVQDAIAGILMNGGLVYRDNTLVDHGGASYRGGTDAGGNY